MAAIVSASGSNRAATRSDHRALSLQAPEASSSVRRAEVCAANADDRRRRRRDGAWSPRHYYDVTGRRGLGPGAEHTPAQRDEPLVVAEKGAVRSEGLSSPGVVCEALAAVGRAGKGNARQAIGRIVAPVVELHVDRAVGRVDSHPLQELVGAVVDRVVVDTHRCGPSIAVVVRARDEHVDIAIAEVAPRHVEPAELRIDTDLRKTHAPRDAWNAAGATEIGSRDVEDRARGLEAPAAVLRDCQRDVEPFVPDDINRAVRRDGTDRADHRTVVIAR